MRNLRRLVVTAVVLLGAMGWLQAGVIEDGKTSFKQVLDDIYKEMGSPKMTQETAEKMDRLIFQRDLHKQPAFSRKVVISWGAYKNMITAVISAEIDGQLEQARVIWRPGQELEMIDLDAVLEW